MRGRPFRHGARAPRWSPSRFRRRQSGPSAPAIRSSWSATPSSPSCWSLMIGVGGGYIYGKQKIEAPGPLQEDKVVNIPARAGMTDIADILQREGVIDNNRWAFIGSVFALKARSELKPGEYSVPEERQPARCHRHHGRGQGGAARRHDSRRPDLRADRGPAFRQRYFCRHRPRNSARRHVAAGNLQISARHHARSGDPAHAAGAEARARGNLGTPQSGHSGQDAGAAGDAGLDRREGNRQGRTSAAGSPRCSSTGCGRR